MTPYCLAECSRLWGDYFVIKKNVVPVSQNDIEKENDTILLDFELTC